MNFVLKLFAFAEIMVVSAFFFKCRFWRRCITEFKTLVRLSNMLFQASVHIDIRSADVLHDEGTFIVYISKCIVSSACSCHHFVNLILVKEIRAVHIQTCHK